METLYDKIGGAAVVDELVDRFYEKVLADPLLSPFFEQTSMATLRKMQKAFLTVALGGPEPDLKVSLYEIHRGRGIQRRHLTRFTELLLETLNEIGVPEQQAGEVIARVATYSDDILGDTAVDG